MMLQPHHQHQNYIAQHHPQYQPSPLPIQHPYPGQPPMQFDSNNPSIAAAAAALAASNPHPATTATTATTTTTAAHHHQHSASTSSSSGASGALGGSLALPDKKYQCRICHRYYRRDLPRHLRTHQETLRFQCPFPRSQCPHKRGQFNRPYDFKKHLLHCHFVFDEQKTVRGFRDLRSKLVYYGTCNCGERYMAETWLDEHVLGGDHRCPLLDPDRASVDNKWISKKSFCIFIIIIIIIIYNWLRINRHRHKLTHLHIDMNIFTSYIYIYIFSLSLLYDSIYSFWNTLSLIRIYCHFNLYIYI